MPPRGHSRGVVARTPASRGQGRSASGSAYRADMATSTAAKAPRRGSPTNSARRCWPSPAAGANQQPSSSAGDPIMTENSDAAMILTAPYRSGEHAARMSTAPSCSTAPGCRMPRHEGAAPVPPRTRTLRSLAGNGRGPGMDDVAVFAWDRAVMAGRPASAGRRRPGARSRTWTNSSATSPTATRSLSKT